MPDCLRIKPNCEIGTIIYVQYNPLLAADGGGYYISLSLFSALEIDRGFGLR
jgi:hypothetical protein